MGKRIMRASLDPLDDGRKSVGGTGGAAMHWTRMRHVLLTLLLPLAACSGSDEAANNAAAAQPIPKPTGPPPLTPTIKNPPIAPGNEAAWMGPRPADDPTTAPYGNLLDQPLVNDTAGR
jgi:hypothetical protein